MNISKHVETVRSGIVTAAALADEHTQDVARRLGTAVDSAARLALLGAISDATSEISAELAPGSVELRVVDGEPDFTVHLPQPTGEPTLLLPEQPADQHPDEPSEDEAEETDEDEPMVRVSLRLPASVKRKVDEVADREGISTNAWLVRAIQNALSPRWDDQFKNQVKDQVVRSVMGPSGVFGDNGPFGPSGLFGDNGPFGEHGPFGGRGPRPPRPPRPPRSPRGGAGSNGNQVKGWVR